MKKKAKKKKPRQRKTVVETQAVQQYMVEASTHVPGTKDRSVIMLWLPLAWGPSQEALETALAMINKERLGPCSFWQQGDRILMLCPLAFPRAQVVKTYTSYKMSKRAAILREREHDWIRITNTMDEDADWQDELQPIGLYGDEANSRTSFSASHLELERRMGIHRQVPSFATFSGKQEPTLRIAVRE